MADPATVSIVIPAKDEAPSIGDVVGRLKAAADWREVIVVDDGSADATADRAREAGACVIRHPYNKGNGAAVKTGTRHASGDFVLIVDGDGQHHADDARRLVARLGEFDLVVGARRAATQATLTRRAGNAVLNRLASYLTGRPIPDLTSGFRGIRRDVLREFLHLLPNGFSTPTTTTLACIKAGYNVTFEPIDAGTRVGYSKMRVARDGASFLMILLKLVTLFSPLRIFAPISGLALTAGALYGVSNFFAAGRIPNGAVVLLLFAVIVFLVGLVSEQITALRFQGRMDR
ncbi:MAG TPA: glycosyltransferase family 2 protein [Vicinamibacterales bacterium]|nr:glycosyltransferase family 2 protein [Vicinamibacterales bacterium]